MGRSQRHKVKIQGVAADGEANAEGVGLAKAGVSYSSTGSPVNNQPVAGNPPYITGGATGGPLKGSLVLGASGATPGPLGDIIEQFMQAEETDETKLLPKPEETPVDQMPAITRLDPESSAMGTDILLRVGGENFTETSIVMTGDARVQQPTEFIDAGSLEVNLPLSTVTAAGPIPVQVVTGEQESNVVDFTVTEAAP